ncbi:MAG TPA: PIN domain-containing protein [Vicinamibacteria bacterium]
MRILFDTNVILDLMLGRPHGDVAGRLVAAVERERLAGLLCATSVTTVEYLVSRTRGRREAKHAIRALLRLFEVAAVTRAVLESALELPFSDYEDAVLHEAAYAAGAEGLVTRNGNDFRRARLPIFSPEELSAAL